MFGKVEIDLLNDTQHNVNGCRDVRFIPTLLKILAKAGIQTQINISFKPLKTNKMKTTLTFRIANLSLEEETSLIQLLINLVRANEITQDEFFHLYKQVSEKTIALKNAKLNN